MSGIDDVPARRDPVDRRAADREVDCRTPIDRAAAHARSTTGFGTVPGQHYLIRLRAPDDYTAQRSYSIASDDDDPLRRARGREAAGRRGVGVPRRRSPRSATSSRCAARSARWFTWDATRPRSAWSAAPAWCRRSRCSAPPAGSGLTDLLRVVAVGRDPDELPYAAELGSLPGPCVAYTRRATSATGPPAPRPRRARAPARRRRARLRLRVGRLRGVRRTLLVELGVPADLIRVEQFGATG